MLKKIILVMAGVVILTGIEVLYAQEEPDRPRARLAESDRTRPGRRQAPEGRQRARGDGEQIRRRQANRDVEPERSQATIRKIRQSTGRLRAELREIERQLEAIKQEVNIKANAPKRRIRQSAGRLTAESSKIKERQEAAQTGMPGDRVGRLQQPRRGLNLPMLQGGQWLDNLTKAYRENDRQKMGQLIRRMHQQRQQWREAQPPFGILPGRMGRRGQERDDRDERAPQRRRMDRRGQGRGTWNEEAPRPGRIGRRGQGRGTRDEVAPQPGRIGRRGQGRGIRDEETPRPGRMGRRVQGRGLVDEQVLQTGRMGRRGRGIPEQSDPEPTEEDQWPEIE